MWHVFSEAESEAAAMAEVEAEIAEAMSQIHLYNSHGTVQDEQDGEC